MVKRFSILQNIVKYSKMDEIKKKFCLPNRYAGSEPSVWAEYGQMALTYKPLNLGQGFPDYPPQKYLMDTLADVSNKSDTMLHQYARCYGHPRLTRVLSRFYSRLIVREINEQTEILTSIGAYEALFSAITGHTDFGDEVVVIEPFFDCYEAMIKYAGGVPKFIPLRLKEVTGRSPTSADWILDKGELEKAFNEKTKIFILNNPNNPLGKVFSMDELIFIADLCKKWNVLCISDEVYEWMVYKPHKHIRMATLPDMWERTITVGSAGKTFSVTGWKVGWAYCPDYLMQNLQIVHQNSVYNGITPVQEAVAIAFEKEIEKLDKNDDDCFFITLAKSLEAKRNYMAKFLIDVGMIPTIPDGGYFMMADWSPLESKVDLNTETDRYKDYRFTKWMSKKVGIQGIPPTVFYSEPNKHLAENFVRYCFIKSDDTLKQVEDVFKRWKNTGK